MDYQDRNKAKGAIKSLAVWGIALMIIGVLIAASAEPGVSTDSFSGEVEETGSEMGYAFGLFLAGVGSILFNAGFIGYAVGLAIRANREEPQQPRPMR